MPMQSAKTSNFIISPSRCVQIIAVEHQIRKLRVPAKGGTENKYLTEFISMLSLSSKPNNCQLSFDRVYFLFDSRFIFSFTF